MNIVAAPDHKNAIDPGRRFEALLLASASIVWWADPAGEIVEPQPHWQDYTGQAWVDYRGGRWISAVHPDDRKAVESDWATALSSGDTCFTHGHIWSAKHRAWRTFQAHGIAVRDHQGRTLEWLFALTDVQDTVDQQRLLDQKDADLARSLKALRDSESSLAAGRERARKEASALRHLAEASGHLWLVRDLDTGLQDVLMASIRLVGADKGSIQKLDAQGILRIRAHHGFDENFLNFFREVRDDNNGASGKALRTGKPVFIPDIDLDPDYQPYAGAARLAGYRSVLSFPIISPGGKLSGVMSTHFAEPTIIRTEALKVFDLYAKLAACFMERLAHEEQVQFLSSEVNHRAKNLLAVVSAIAYSTVPAPARNAFNERLRALAAVHDLVVYREWKQVELRALAERQLASFMQRGRIRMEGPDVMLNASDAQSLGMALHELLTNSIKYGALSNREGEISLGWSVSLHGDGHQHVMVRWVESGGPPVRPPVARGFGTRVLERFAEHSLDGSAGLEFAPEGLRWKASWRNSPSCAIGGA
jgi:two-component sensor histidine kinase